MLDIVIMILTGICCFLVILTAIAFIRANDIFTLSHIAMIFNFYIVPLILILMEIKNFSTINFIKIITLIIINLLISFTLCHVIIRRVMINKIYPDAEEIRRRQ